METKTKFPRSSVVEWTEFGNSMAWEGERFILLGERHMGEKEKLVPPLFEVPKAVPCPLRGANSATG